MPTFEFTSPRGDTFEVSAPEGATPEQAFGVVHNISTLADAIQAKESGGNPNATSIQGARGSMQITKPTFVRYAVPGQDDFGNDAHRRAAALRKLTDDYLHYGGDMARTAAAYLGGRGAVLPDGTIRDDVHDALGTSPAAYVRDVLSRMPQQPQAPDSLAGGGRGTVNPPVVDPTAPPPQQPAGRTYSPPELSFDPESSGGPEIAQALQQPPAAGAGRGFVNPPAAVQPREVGFGESAGRMWGQAGAQAAEIPSLLVAATGVAWDKLHSAISGKEQTGAQDWMFRNLVDPRQEAVDWYALKPDEKQSFLGQVGGALGSMAQDLPMMIASGGAKQRVELAQQFPTMARYLENALSAGYDAMRPIMVKAGTEKAKQVLDAGGTTAQAMNAATVEALWTGLSGGQPMSAEGRMLQRAATGIPVGIAQSEAGRAVSNAAAPPGMQQPFDAGQALAGGVTNAVAAGGLGHRAQGPMPDRVDLGYEPTKSPVAEAVQGMGEAPSRGPQATPGMPAHDPVAEVMNAPTVEAAAAAAARVAAGGREPSVADEMRAIRPEQPVQLREASDQLPPTVEAAPAHAEAAPEAAGPAPLDHNTPGAMDLMQRGLSERGMPEAEAAERSRIWARWTAQAEAQGASEDAFRRAQALIESSPLEDLHQHLEALLDPIGAVRPGLERQADAAAAPRTADTVRQELRGRWGGIIDTLERAGILKIWDNVDQYNRSAPEERARLPASVAGAQQGMYLRGVAHLFADGLDPHRAVGVLLHEVGEHASMREMLGEQRYGDLVDRAYQLADDGDPIARAAAARIPPETPAKYRDSEMLAYLIEEGANRQQEMTPGVRKWMLDAISNLRAWFYQTDFAKQLQQRGIGLNLTPQDIVALADRAVRWRADQAGGGSYADALSSRTPGRKETLGEHDAYAQKDGSLIVRGDPDQIRSLLPEGVVGRAVSGGLSFTPSAAPRVRAALAGENKQTAYGRQGKVLKQLPMKDGKYVGAPEKFDTPQRIPTLRRILRSLAEEGAPGRYWYENSSRAILQMVGHDVQEARRFVSLLAIYSPLSKVDANTTFALRAWAQYKMGEPISVKTAVQDHKAQRALQDVDGFWSGEKTGNFFRNLLAEIDPATRGKQGATIDMWMMRAAQYPTDVPSTTQYAFMENEVNRLAAQLGWEPQQVQAAIWVAMKARMENPDVKRAVDERSLKNGWIRFDRTVDENGKPKKERVKLNEQAHRDNWLDAAMAHKVTKEDTEDATFDFSNGVRRHIGQVSWEPRPGRSTDILPGIHDAPYEQQVEFQQAIQRAFYDAQGNDLLAMKLGLLETGSTPGPGVWQGEVSAGAQQHVAMAPAKGDEGKAHIDPAQKRALDVYAATLGLLLRQEGVGYHRTFYATNKGDQNGVELRIDRPFTPDEAKALWSALDERMRDAGAPENWDDSAGLISSPDGMRVINFGAVEDNRAFRNLVAAAVADLPLDVHGFVEFASDGNLVTNDWKEHPNGQDFAQVYRTAGRQDLYGWARDVLGPPVQRTFEDFSQRYGWGDPGQVADAFRAGLGDGRAEGSAAGAGGVSGRGEDEPQHSLAYHGSPHEFDRFRIDRIGTGEGAQAYGHGLYFAENPNVADSYRKQLSGDTLLDGGKPNRMTLGVMQVFILDMFKNRKVAGLSDEQAREQTLKWADQHRQIQQILGPERTRDFVSRLSTLPGSLYQVDIPDPVVARMLLWDKPLSEQPASVKAALAPILAERGVRAEGTAPNGNEWKLTGGQLYDRVVGNGSPREASALLDAAGIPGIKYLDGQSRNRPLKDIKREFLAQLPEDADFEEVLDLAREGKFSPANAAVVEALAKDDWLGFDYPAQAISAALSGRDLANYDASPALKKAVQDVQADATHNLVVFNDRNVKITQRNGEPVSAAQRTQAVQDMHAQRDEEVAQHSRREQKPAPRQERPFYSGLARGIEGIPAKAQPADGWRAQIEGLINKGLAKRDEVEFSGLYDWLRTQQGKVTKEQVLDYLAHNGVQVHEVVKGSALDAADQINRHLEPMGFHAESDTGVGDELMYIDDRTGDLVDFNDLPPEAQAVIERASQGENGAITGPTKYGQYTLPGGKNYRELLLTLPKVSSGVSLRPGVTRQEVAQAIARAIESSDEYASSLPVVDKVMRSKDVLRTLNEELPKAEWDRAFQNLTGRPSDAYRSAHWDEPNILAHIRLNDRTDADGKRVLFVEELQSDWAQAARKEGFKQPDTTSARREELKQQIAALVDRRAEVRRNDDGALTSEQQRVELWKLSDELERLGEEHSALTAPLTKGVPQAPFVGKTDAWLSLALRRIIKMAADEGYDRVAFVNGDQSAARYGLSQVVNRITWEPTRNQALIAVKLELEGSPWVLNVRTNDGTVASVGGGASTDLQGHSLGDIVGKEIAAGILRKESGELKGDDLKVGGSGMRAFYDNIVPAAVNKLLPKMGGEKMGVVDLTPPFFGKYSVDEGPDDPVRHFDTRAEAEAFAATLGEGPDYVIDNTRFRPGLEGAPREQPGFDVTPALRQRTADGVPMFSRRGATAATAGMPTTAPVGTWERAKAIVSDLIDEGLSRAGVYRFTSPMSEGSVRARDIAQKFANQERLARHEWQRISDLLQKRFTPDERRQMWEAADEQNTLLQQGQPTAGRGLDTLTPEMRDAVEQLHNYGEELLRRAKNAGMFEGDGLPYWTPRMMVMIDGNGEYVRPTEPGRTQTSGGEGRNVFTTSQNLKQRKYVTAAETEAAMQAKGGELVRDIMTMPLAMQRLERAIAGRELVNQIKDLGRATGVPTVSTGRPDHEGWFTLDHTSFTTFRPRFERDDATGHMTPVLDQNGDMVFDRVPLYMSKEFEGPIRAILANTDGPLYRAFMLLKSKAMSAIMFSPLIHNLVIFGRALGYDPTIAGTVALYFKGHAARQDNALMRTAIQAGMVPMGYNRQGMNDITDIARGFGKEGGWLDPHESWIAHGARAILGAVHKPTGAAAKRFIDKAGDIWHGSLLWDRVADLQMGIFAHAYERLQEKGFEPGVARAMAAHWANRYAGAVARENMGPWARKAANVLLFSRSFNMGNLGTVKDMFFGMPSGMRAAIEAEYGRAGASKAFTEARRKAFSGFVADTAMSLIALSLAQSVVDRLKKDKSWEEIFGGYTDRAARMWENIKAHPANPKSYSPWQLSPTHDNEPGKQDRVDMGEIPDQGGRHEYMRLPTGKVVEDLINWTTHFPTTFSSKTSPQVKAAWQVLTNDRGFGVPVYDPNGDVSAGALAVAKHLAESQTPWDTIVTAWDKLHGKATAIENDKLVGNMTGFTYSQGHPGGPEAGVAADVEDRLKAQKMLVMEEVKRLLKYDHEDEARQKLEDIGLSPREVSTVIKHIEEPSGGISRSQQKRFNQHSTDQDQDRMDRVNR